MASPTSAASGDAADEDEVRTGAQSHRIARPRARLRHSLAARISALVLLVVAATASSAVVTLGQLRSLRAGFDRLTEVYVQFNHDLASAHVQAVRIGEQVRTHQSRPAAAPEPRVDDAYLANFALGLKDRSAQIAAARAPIDEALADRERFGGKDQLQQLEEIQAALNDLEGLARLDEMVEPIHVLGDVRTQQQIEQRFEALAQRSNGAIEALRGAYGETQEQAERLTLGLTLGVSVVGFLAAIGVVLALRPLRRLSESVRSLGRGDWSQRVDASVTMRDDEVGHLGAEFNEMASALEERERRLIRGERLAAAGQLAAQITHEIRNPLSSVALNAELLEDELEGAPKARELLAKISREVDRLTAVTEGYLRFARRPKPELSDLDLGRQIDDLTDFMQHEFEAAGIEVVTRLPEVPAWVRGDPSQLRQAFMNLLRNAAEALTGEEPGQGTADPRIQIAVHCKEDRVIVVVEDNGPGIGLDKDKLDSIFEAFFTRKARGTGLGLPTVQQILQDHEGSVRVAETSASGTIFEVSLPACRPSGASVSSDSSET